MKKTLMFLAIILITFISLPIFSFAGVVGCGCYCGKVLRPPCSEDACKQACGWQGPSSPGGGSSVPAYNYEAERQRQEAERQRQLEAERQRQQEIEEQRKQEEEAARKKQDEFDRNKEGTLKSMKGFGGEELGLKGTDSNDLGLKEIGDTGKGSLGLKGLENNKAVKEAESNLYNTTEKGAPGAVFDTKGEKSPRSYLTVVVPATGEPIQMSERARKDPRMIKTLKELEALQVKRQKLDAERTKLRTERKQH